MLGISQTIAHPPGMRKSVGCVALFFLIALHTQDVTATKARQMPLSQDLVTSNGTRADYATLHGVPHWRLLPHLWVDKTVRLHWAHGKVESLALMQMPACHAELRPFTAV